MRCPHRIAALLASLVLASAAHAAGNAQYLPQTDDNTQKLDAAIQALKDEAVEFNREALAVEQVVLAPDGSRTAIYVGMRVSGLLLQSINVTLDERPPVQLSFSDKDARALILSDGLARVLNVTLAPGTHRIRASYTAQFHDAKDGAAPVTGTLDKTFEKTDRPLTLELQIGRNSRYSASQMALRTWSPREAGDEEEATAEDPKAKRKRRSLR